MNRAFALNIPRAKIIVQAASHSAAPSARRCTYCYDGAPTDWRIAMTTARLAIAIALALLGSKAEAGPQATARVFTADFYLGGCKDFIARKSNFFAGRCVGPVEVLDAFDWATMLCSPPARNG